MLKSLARRSWNASHRPGPPAPCRNRSGGPEPACSIWTGGPRTESACGVGISGDEETAVRRQPLPGEERAVVGREEERGGGDLVLLAGPAQRRARGPRRADEVRRTLGPRPVHLGLRE